MLFRVLLTAVVLSISLYFVPNFLEQWIIPQSSADLAVQQIEEDGSRELMRAQERIHNWIDPVNFLVTLTLLYFIWAKKIKELYCVIKRSLKEKNVN